MYARNAAPQCFLLSSFLVWCEVELKEALRRIDVDANGLMALLEYLLFKVTRKPFFLMQYFPS